MLAVALADLVACEMIPAAARPEQAGLWLHCGPDAQCVLLSPWLTLIDRGSGMLIELTIAFAVLLGLVGLGIDGTRWFFLRSELQYIASSAAMAGAHCFHQEQSDGAIQCARNAASNIAAAR